MSNIQKFVFIYFHLNEIKQNTCTWVFFCFHFTKDMDFNILTKAKQKIEITYELKPEQITALRTFMESNGIVYWYMSTNV